MKMNKMMSGGRLWSWRLTVLAAGAALLLTSSSSSSSAASTTAELSTGTTDFACRLYRAVSSSTDDNVLLSPFSLSAALAMLAGGSAGPTQQQLLAALSLGSLEPTEIPGLFQALQNSITGDGAFPLKQGIAVFPFHAFTLAPSYLALVQNMFRGNAQTLTDPTQQETVDSINSWAKSQTSDRVKDVVGVGGVGSLDSQSQLLLLSVTDYQTQFSFGFNISLTQDERFYVDKYHIIQVPMMLHVGKHVLAYDPSLRLGLLKLPMADATAMLVMLPDENVSLTSVEEELTATRFQGWLRQLKKTKLEVQLPRFLLGGAYSLKDVLTQMDAKDVFQDTADLSIIAPEAGLRLTEVYHKSAVTVDESGPIAGVNREDTFASPRLTINRPFLFIIYHQKTKSILHIGRVVDPSNA